MCKIVYKKNGILVNDEFINLSEIIEKCSIEKVNEEGLYLLKMEWKGWRGFDEGILENIVLSGGKIEILKKNILGKTIYFGEIAGKHSEIYNTLDDNDIEIIENSKAVVEFLSKHPNGHTYNHSFLYRFYDYALDGGYDNISEEDLNEFKTIFQ